MIPTMSNSMLKLTDAEFNYIKDYVYKTYGIDLSKKRQLIEGRLSYTLKSKGLASFDDYFKVIKRDPIEMQEFINKITTNHSYFGRENDHFQYLYDIALPELAKRNNQTLKIWSAGCSAGQEAYNISMVFDQYSKAKNMTVTPNILATDISTNVINNAKLGKYNYETVKGLPPGWLTKYFKKVDDINYVIDDKIKSRVTFKKANLMESSAVTEKFDIIFCRNVMIYFDYETTQRTIEKFYNSLNNNGYFFMGHSESLDRNRSKFTYIKPAIYQKRQV